MIEINVSVFLIPHTYIIIGMIARFIYASQSFIIFSCNLDCKIAKFVRY